MFCGPIIRSAKGVSCARACCTTTSTKGVFEEDESKLHYRSPNKYELLFLLSAILLIKGVHLQKGPFVHFRDRKVTVALFVNFVNL